MPSNVAHAWKYLSDDHKGSFYFGLGPPFNIGIPPTGVSQIRKVNYSTGLAEIVAEGVRNSVGADVDPRSGDFWFTENARDWMSDDTPSDKLNHVAKFGEHFGYPYCHQGDLPDPKFAMATSAKSLRRLWSKLGAHVAPLGVKFYTGTMFPQEYSDNIFSASASMTNAAFLGSRDRASACRLPRLGDRVDRQRIVAVLNEPPVSRVEKGRAAFLARGPSLGAFCRFAHAGAHRNRTSRFNSERTVPYSKISRRLRSVNIAKGQNALAQRGLATFCPPGRSGSRVPRAYG
jgi:glucose/arabinose dehydrogenase